MDPQVIHWGVGKTDEELLSAGAAQQELAEGLPAG
jgi:hypothetical protein